MKFFVTGGSGFIGGCVVWKLLERGHEVTALVRDPEKGRRLEATGAKTFEGDLSDVGLLEKGMKDHDGLFHIAAWYRIGDRDVSPAYRTNVEGTQNILKAMKRAGVPKGVYTSTVGVFSDTKGKIPDETYRYHGPMLTEYERTKYEAHYDVALPMIAEGLPLVIVQPGVVYGPGDHSAVANSIQLFLKRQLPMIPKGAAYSWSHVDDIAEGHILAFEKGKIGESYLLTGEAASIEEVFSLASRITGMAAPKILVPPWVFKSLSHVARGVEVFAELPDLYSSEGLRVSAGVTFLGNSAKAREELGFENRPLEEGLKEAILHEQEKLALKTV